MKKRKQNVQEVGHKAGEASLGARQEVRHGRASEQKDAATRPAYERGGGGGGGGGGRGPRYCPARAIKRCCARGLCSAWDKGGYTVHSTQFLTQCTVLSHYLDHCS